MTGHGSRGDCSGQDQQQFNWPNLASREFTAEFEGWQLEVSPARELSDEGSAS
jgi:hypothetical protein